MCIKNVMAIGQQKNMQESLSPDQIVVIKSLQKLSKLNQGKQLTLKILHNASMRGQGPSAEVVKDRFGSVGKAMEIAGLSYQDLSREGMIAQIKELARILKRTPLHTELDEFYQKGLCFSRGQLSKSSFNGYADLLEKAELQLNSNKRPSE